jgi:hypothetical protein
LLLLLLLWRRRRWRLLWFVLLGLGSSGRWGVEVEDGVAVKGWRLGVVAARALGTRRLVLLLAIVGDGLVLECLEGFGRVLAVVLALAMLEEVDDGGTAGGCSGGGISGT